jgi:hypothetical protein
MQDSTDARMLAGQNFLETFPGKIANANEPFRLQSANNRAQVFVARSEQGCPLVPR